MKSYSFKTFIVLLSVILPCTFIAQTPCVDNMAGGFPCSGFDLQDRLTNEQMDTDFSNDSWGWTDPEDGKEYAIIGLRNGTAFIDISDPVNVIYLGKLPTHTVDSGWRDIKVYQNYAFIVSEAEDHGMQVFDLTRLRNVPAPPVTFTEDAHYDGFGNAHNIVINPSSGFAYGVGTQTFEGGPHFINIEDPLNPVAAGGYADNSYSHDAQVVTYNGPDTDYIGREILIGSNEDEIAIVDITDKDNPVEISTLTYPAIGYTHQGWFTEDQRYFLLGDELDELDFGFPTRTIVLDFLDLDAPEFYFDYEGTNNATDHNGYVLGNIYYLASYRAGMRVIDITNIGSENMTEIGYFDTVPSSNNVGTSGLWNVYPFFESGNIVLSGNNGFTLVKQNETLAVDTFQATTETSIYPNPSSGTVFIESKKPLGTVTIFNALGQPIFKRKVPGLQTQYNLSYLQTGIYFVQTDTTTQKLIIQ